MKVAAIMVADLASVGPLPSLACDDQERLRWGAYRLRTLGYCDCVRAVPLSMVNMPMFSLLAYGSILS